MNVNSCTLITPGVYSCENLFLLPSLSLTTRFRYSNGKKRTVCYMHWPDGGFPTSKADYMSVISKLLLLWFILCVFVTAGKNVNLKMLFYSWRGGRGGFFSFTFSQWMGKVKAYPGTVNFKFFTDFSL